MNNTGDQPGIRPISVVSSVDETMRPRAAASGSFDCWHFDAISDDGSEAVVISFYNNYPFSPRYFASAQGLNGSGPVPTETVPAISFCYSRKGAAPLTAVSELCHDEYRVDGEISKFGNSSFRIEEAEYGSGYMVNVEMLTRRKRKIVAQFEWLFVESSMRAANSAEFESRWNIAAPRADVSGRITLIDRRGKEQQVIHFRGTGYHDRFSSDRSLADAVGSRVWGRAHFVDCTAIFHSFGPDERLDGVSDIFLIRDGEFHEQSTSREITNFARDRFALKTPRRLTFVSDDNIRLRIKPLRRVLCGFFEAKMLAEVNLMLRDGKPRRTLGLIEFAAPRRMKNRLLRLLNDLRVGKKGKSPLF